MITGEISFHEYKKLSDEYASIMLRKYDKTVLPFIQEATAKCRCVLGDSDKHVINVYEGFKLSNINKISLREMLPILYELRTTMAWR